MHEDEDLEANLASLTDFKKAKGVEHLQGLKISLKGVYVHCGKMI